CRRRRAAARRPRIAPVHHGLAVHDDPFLRQQPAVAPAVTPAARGNGIGAGRLRVVVIEDPGGARFEALGTTVTVLVTDRAQLDAARAAVVAEVEAIDRACSRFRDDSELARLNAA